MFVLWVICISLKMGNKLDFEGQCVTIELDNGFLTLKVSKSFNKINQSLLDGTFGFKIQMTYPHRKLQSHLLSNWDFALWVFDLLCNRIITYILDLLGPNQERFYVSKSVKYIAVTPRFNPLFYILGTLKPPSI